MPRAPLTTCTEQKEMSVGETFIVLASLTYSNLYKKLVNKEYYCDVTKLNSDGQALDI